MNEFLLYLGGEEDCHLYRITDNPLGLVQRVVLTTQRTINAPHIVDKSYTLDYIESYNGDWGELSADWNLQYVHAFSQNGWHLLKERS